MNTHMHWNTYVHAYTYKPYTDAISHIHTSEDAKAHLCLCSYTCRYNGTLIFMNTNIDGVEHFCSCACTCKFTGTLKFMHTHMQIQSHTFTFVHTHSWRCTGTYVHAHMQMYWHTYLYAYTCKIHTQRENERDRNLFVKVQLRTGVRNVEINGEMFEEQFEWRYRGKIWTS